MEIPSFIFKLSSHIPFGFTWITKKLLGNPKTVLDLGCGKGELMGSLKAERRWKVTGVDIFKSSLNDAAKTGVYKELILGDIVKICGKLIKEKRKFDLVFASGVIEHITQKDGEKLLELVDKLAKERIFFNTPNDFMNQPDDYMLGNPHQAHKSGWLIKDFTSRGYKVYGLGFSPLWTEKGMARSENLLAAFIARIISFILSPVTFFLPFIASGIMAVKRVSSLKKSERRMRVLYPLLFLIIFLLILLKASNANPSDNFFYSFKRLSEKTRLTLMSDSSDKLRYQYELLDKRLQELSFVVENGISEEILTSSLRYSTTAGQITEQIIQEGSVSDGKEAIKKFKTHLLMVKGLPEKYVNHDSEEKFIVDAANYLVVYTNQLSAFTKDGSKNGDN